MRLLKRKIVYLKYCNVLLCPKLVNMSMIYARSNCVQPVSNFTLTCQPLMCEDTTIISWLGMQHKNNQKAITVLVPMNN